MIIINDLENPTSCKDCYLKSFGTCLVDYRRRDASLCGKKPTWCPVEDAKEKLKAEYDKGYKDRIADIEKEEKLSIDAAETYGYESGLNDAWEAAKKVACTNWSCGLDIGILEKVFGTCGTSTIMINFTPSEVISRIKDYEEKQAIRIGDEVENIVDVKPNVIGVVTKIQNRNDGDLCYYILGKDGSYWFKDSGIIRRTGRHFDEVGELLEKMKEGEK